MCLFSCIDIMYKVKKGNKANLLNQKTELIFLNAAVQELTRPQNLTFEHRSVNITVNRLSK